MPDASRSPAFFLKEKCNLTIIQTLAPDLKEVLKKADEIWVAVALITSYGLKFINDNISKKCKQNYLVGINLPTEPKALKQLLKFSHELSVNLILQKEFYHPKVYLVRKGSKYTAFLGSANCTAGGFYKNIEISIKIENQRNCRELLMWFENLRKDSKPLTDSFIMDYTISYNKRVERKKADEHAVKKEKNKFNEEIKLNQKKRTDLVKMLKKYRANKEYQAVKKKQNRAVEELKLSLDYPKFAKIDVDRFFKLWDLGRLIEIPKTKIKLEIKKFSRLLRMICDEKNDIEIRYDKALAGNFKIWGVSEGLISKVLTIHDPQKYYVKNKKSDSVLGKYGLQLPKELTPGAKYEFTLKPD